ncbi:MAG: XRE family transcriptional regulator [Microbacteriaceae bacterium]|nr:MAG: XRE family transcriptional regulator [Microbacteriaceae bacterium]
MPRVASDAAAHIGRRIADRRQSLGMTQDEVAVISGIDSSNVRAYESGRAMPSIQSLVRIAIALDVEPGELLRGLTLELFSAPTQGGRRGQAS